MSLMNALPKVRGVLQENANLGKRSLFGVGGPAEVLFLPADMDDLVFFLSGLPEGVNVTVLGAISNVLIRSGGIDGVVIILCKWFDNIFIEDNIIEVGAAVKCSRLSTFAMDAEIGGLEFLMGLPGSIGGALKMNAGCYGAEVKDILVELEAVSIETGYVKWFKTSEINFEYRKSNLPSDLIITRAWFKGIEAPTYSISKKTNELMKKRKETQPIDKRSCGSTFKNAVMYKAWELIDQAGCRGLKIGGAAVSEKHCNFIINEADATPEDLEDLGNLIVKRVYENSGVTLEWEVVRVGKRIAN